MLALFDILFLTGKLGEMSQGEKPSSGNLSCYISETEGRGKLKFREVSFQIGPKLLRENRAKNRPT